ncbi:hypothetical protein E4U19_000387 [Claviceps sp. Clav32 group G5]|nr:hypothetical protein E4U19_000387 [Claviceps sp. Clav32 group G5]
MTSSQDEFLSPEETILKTEHAIAEELPSSIRRYDKDISCHWKTRYVDPTIASPQDATDWIASRIHGYTENDKLTHDDLLASAFALRNLLQKHGIETKKGSGDSIPKILHDIVQFGKADPIVPTSPFRPIAPSHPVNEAQPTQMMQQMLLQTLQQMQQQPQHTHL